MISSPLLSTIVTYAQARHIVFVGDRDQLPPIGPGKPLRDALAAEIIPTTYLTKNWRTDCQGIRDICADMLTLDKFRFAARFRDYEKAGGVEFVNCAWNERATTAAMIVVRLVDQGIDLEQIAILSPHKDGDAGCEAANLAVRDVLNLDPQEIEENDLLIIGRNNYHARSPNDDEIEETIYNGERCNVVKCGSDFLDLIFPKNSEGLIRRVRLFMNDPDGNAIAQLPEHVLFGYAMSTHKAQGSQFDYVTLLAERGYRDHGVVQGSNVYTATSRARKKVVIVGKPDDYAQAATTPETPRRTLLKLLLKRDNGDGEAD